MTKVVFVGDKPSKKNLHKDLAFVGTISYKTLMNWITELDCSGNYTMINSHTSLLLDMAEYEWLNGASIVALGNEAAKRLNARGIYFLKLPHPSPRNRKLNDKEFIKTTLRVLKQYLKGEAL